MVLLIFYEIHGFWLVFAAVFPVYEADRLTKCVATFGGSSIFRKDRSPAREDVSWLYRVGETVQEDEGRTFGEKPAGDDLIVRISDARN